MYMRNNRSAYDRYAQYNIGNVPANYSGQYRENPAKKADEIDFDREREAQSHNHSHEDEQHKHEHSELSEHEHKEHKEHKEYKGEEKKEKHKSLIGGLFNGDKGGSGILSKLFGEKDGGAKGILGGLELEDLILFAVIFFLMKDGIEDDFLIILALILLV